MRQLVLVLLAGVALGSALWGSTLAAPQEPAQFEVPCNDDGLAHIPELPEGARRPYSVRKRSRTAHRDPEVADDTPQLPPGRRRFDAVLPDEQGHDITTPARSQRRLSYPAATPPGPEEDSNEVAEQQQQGGSLTASERPHRRPTRRPAYPKKVVVPREPEVGENYPTDHPAFHHNPKNDAVVDSYEAVRKYPTHLPEHQDEQDDDNLTNNDVSGVPRDQLAQEDVSTEQLGPNSVPADVPADLPPGYHSKFPKRTFASDLGGSGDVLRIKPRRKGSNQYVEPPAQEVADDVQPIQQQAARPQPRPQPRPQDEEQTPAPAAPEQQTRGRQRYRASHKVGADGDQQQQRRQPARRRPDPEVAPEAAVDAGAPSQPEEVPEAQPQRPLRRRPRPRPSPGPDAELGQQEVPAQRTAPRRRPRPQPVQPEEVEVQDNAVLENTVSPEPDSQPPPRRPLRRRPRPRPAVQTEEQSSPAQSSQDPDNVADPAQRRPSPRRRPRPEQYHEESSQDVQASPRRRPQQQTRGRGRVLAEPRQQETVSQKVLPQVEVEHDGTAAEKKAHEPTLVRSAVKKVPSGGGAGNPSPALISKIVKNTLRRLKPQIAEHEGDVGVDILVKIFQVDE